MSRKKIMQGQALYQVWGEMRAKMFPLGKTEGAELPQVKSAGPSSESCI